jgi:hypothetical protein
MRKKVDAKRGALGLLFLIGMSGCSTPGKSAGAGAAIGAGVGGTAGLLADPGDGGNNRIRNVLIGAGIGGALGAGAGLLMGNSSEDQKKDAYAQGQKAGQAEGANSAAADSKAQPRLIPAKTQARWVSDQVRGNIFTPAHFEFLIIEPAHWEVGK